MTSDPRLKYVATQFRAMADLIDAGLILDAAYVVTPKEGDPYMGFSIAPKKQELLMASLHELAVWVGQTEKNAAVEKAMAELA